MILSLQPLLLLLSTILLLLLSLLLITIVIHYCAFKALAMCYVAVVLFAPPASPSAAGRFLPVAPRAVVPLPAVPLPAVPLWTVSSVILPPVRPPPAVLPPVVKPPVVLLRAILQRVAPPQVVPPSRTATVRDEGTAAVAEPATLIRQAGAASPDRAASHPPLAAAAWRARCRVDACRGRFTVAVPVPPPARVLRHAAPFLTAAAPKCRGRIAIIDAPSPRPRPPTTRHPPLAAATRLARGRVAACRGRVTVDVPGAPARVHRPRGSFPHSCGAEMPRLYCRRRQNEPGAASPDHAAPTPRGGDATRPRPRCCCLPPDDALGS